MTLDRAKVGAGAGAEGGKGVASEPGRVQTNGRGAGSRGEGRKVEAMPALDREIGRQNASQGPSRCSSVRRKHRPRCGRPAGVQGRRHLSHDEALSLRQARPPPPIDWTPQNDKPRLTLPPPRPSRSLLARYSPYSLNINYSSRCSRKKGRRAGRVPYFPASQCDCFNANLTCTVERRPRISLNILLGRSQRASSHAMDSVFPSRKDMISLPHQLC